MIERMVRVNHAGELAADYIYRGQALLLSKDPTAGPLLLHMWQQEKEHLATLQRIERRLPTSL